MREVLAPEERNIVNEQDISLLQSFQHCGKFLLV